MLSCQEIEVLLKQRRTSKLRQRLRLLRSDLTSLASNALWSPEVVVTSSRDRCFASEALCITLYRMSYPRRYYDIMATFGRLVMYSAVVKTKGSYMDNIFGFIDGSKFEICRITQKRDRFASNFADLQRLIYSGHKRRPA
ncbi:hypothetical protein H257_05959 [Aphanomyces astaci]|uniref:DDE Tnp4 domain-containing protein n=1 Tax=Aphanomyces astaci TaxID=112090 RepID=W4GNX8_APHAT|nr:hypothetical protein H257_05959 [Aphanomyces astaci]ETV81435.1 hypothetical protein H257_05959 [Aphanomyces astaci]|eukprot:XP_009829293.1 hypothetical protein H257_05959 [Aphanomyces astaci]